MCNVAGYLGSEQAAPILLDMLAREEGFAGGYYTGVATIDGGRLHYAKVVGDLKTLRANSNAADLPGTVGIAHSRSKSGGDREWSHPFLDCAGKLAYVANGSGGILEKPADKNAIAQRLADAGHTFRSRSPEPIGSYPVLKDGTCTHTSEVMCHLIESGMAEGLSLAEAMRRAYLARPAEIVGLAIHSDYPDFVAAARFNQPLMIGRTGEATYLATTALAFPPDVVCGSLEPLPILSAATIYGDRTELLPFEAELPVADGIPWQAGRKMVTEALAVQDSTAFGELKKASARLWPEGMAVQRDMMNYEILRELHEAGCIAFETEQVPGVLPGTTAPRFRARVVDG